MDKKDKELRYKKIPFNVMYRPEIESGRYRAVVGEDNRPARIICWDALSANAVNIVALVQSKSGNGAENILRYNLDGSLISDSARVGRKDLFILTDELELDDLDEFEWSVRELILAIKSAHHLLSSDRIVCNTTRNWASYLRGKLKD